MLSNLAIAQSFSYSYIDPCNGKTYKLDIPYGQNQIAVTYYGQVKTFTADDFNNGNFEGWASGVFNQYQNASPCGGIGTAVTISQSQSTALTIVGILNSLSALSDMANSGGSGNILAATGSMNKAKDSKKNKNNNSTPGGSSTNGTTVGNSTGSDGANTSGTTTSGGSSTNGNSTTTGGQNQGNGSSNTTGNSSTSGNNQSTTPNQTGGTNAGGSGTTGGQNGTTTGTQNNTTTGNSQSSQPTVNGTSPSTTPNSGTTPGNSTTPGESSTAGSTTNGGTTASGGSTTSGSGTSSGGTTASGGSGTKVSGEGTSEKPTDATTPDGEKKSDAMGGTVNAVKAVNKNGGKPSILLSSDLVGFQFNDNEIAKGTKINSGYTSMRYDGLRTHGFLVDYTSSIKGPNITGFYAWIKPKAITLFSNTLTFGRVGSGSVYNTVAFGQMRNLPYKIKAVYMLTFSGGQIYKESYYGSAGIVGFNRDFKINKRLEVKAMALFVYAPFVRYYQDEVLKSPYVILPIVGTNIGVTKKFKININFGGAYSMGDNVLNYTVMMGTRLAL